MSEPTREEMDALIDALDAVEADERQRQEDEEVGRLVRELLVGGETLCLHRAIDALEKVTAWYDDHGTPMTFGRADDLVAALRALRDAIGGEG